MDTPAEMAGVAGDSNLDWPISNVFLGKKEPSLASALLDTGFLVLRRDVPTVDSSMLLNFYSTNTTVLREAPNGVISGTLSDGCTIGEWRVAELEGTNAFLLAVDGYERLAECDPVEAPLPRPAPSSQVGREGGGSKLWACSQYSLESTVVDDSVELEQRRVEFGHPDFAIYSCQALNRTLEQQADIGASSVEYCLPLPGFYGSPGSAAQECPEGGACCTCPNKTFATLDEGLRKLKSVDGFNYVDFCDCLAGSMPFPFPLHGFVRSEEAGFEEKLVACPTPSSCLGALAVTVELELAKVVDTAGAASSPTEEWTSNRCDSGYTGRLCKACDTDYYEISGMCLKCPDGLAARLLLTIGGGILVVVSWVFLGVYMAGTFESLNILLLYLQIGSMLQSFDMDWADEISIWAVVQQIVGWGRNDGSVSVLRWNGGAMQIVNFDVDIIGPQCVIPAYGYGWSYFLQLLLPIVVTLANGLPFAWRRHRILREVDRPVVQTKLEIGDLFNQTVARVLSFQVSAP
eukprot:gene2007-2693_t